MADLVNTASLSHSFLATLEECPRRAYLHRFGSWGGWLADAPESARLAYRLKRQTGIYALIGQVVERECMDALGRARQGGTVTAPIIVEACLARLRTAWAQTKREGWRRSPKRVTCISELYYGDRIPAREVTHQRIATCVESFLRRMPEWLAVPAEDFATIPERDAFDFEGLTVYAQPDISWRAAGGIFIDDLKTGRPKPEDEEQIGLYCLWAHAKLGEWPARARLVYLLTGDAIDTTEITSDGCVVEAARSRLRAGRERYRDLLIDRDLARHEPLPIEAWRMNLAACRMCSFREGCGVAVPAGTKKEALAVAPGGVA